MLRSIDSWHVVYVVRWHYGEQKGLMYRVPTPPGKSRKILDSFVKFPVPGKSWKMDLVLESPGNFSGRSWKVLEFFARL